MANNADGTDGKGSMKMGKSQVSGKNDGGYGHTASRGIPSGGKAVSGKEAGSYGTRTGKAPNTHFPTGADQKGTDKGVSHNGGW